MRDVAAKRNWFRFRLSTLLLGTALVSALLMVAKERSDRIRSEADLRAKLSAVEATLARAHSHDYARNLATLWLHEAQQKPSSP